MVGAWKRKMPRLLCRFATDEAAATAIEYGMIATFIFLAIMTAVALVGTNLQQPFQAVSDGLS
jgi:Flp pilus assembly pilin Flp